MSHIDEAVLTLKQNGKVTVALDTTLLTLSPDFQTQLGFHCMTPEQARLLAGHLVAAAFRADADNKAVK